MKDRKIESTFEMEQRNGESEVDGVKLEKIKQEMKILRRNRICQAIAFLIIFMLDVADLLSDWLLYVDIYLAEAGLVYGPPASSIINALLAFSIIGSITFILEAVNMGKEIFTMEAWVDTDLMSAIIIWIEDVPQIIINVFIAICREDPISVFQLTKASVILLSLVIRIIASLIRYTSKKAIAEAKKHTHYTNRHIAYHFFIMFGLLVNAGCAIAVFIFTQTSRDASGNLSFQIPDSVFEDKYNDQRYFQNVSVYFHHSTFDYVDSDASDTKANWMRLMKINTIREQKSKRALFNYEYQDTTAELRMALWEKINEGNWEVQECYTVNKVTKQITNETNCATFLTGSSTSVIFLFYFVSPDTFFRRLLFGDIKYNLKVNDTSTCKNVDDLTDSIEDGIAKNLPTIHYYRTTESEVYHLLSDNGQVRFYKNDADFEDIESVWETGWGKCDPTGTLAPHADDSLHAPCYKTT
ncbi:uncharacterized protein LOC126824878 [Patella vulgata]|uniref:uncharacterized protein LOC126824878 n=1 Tax=Patella vulgata TaxID=6465 RepID=UPI0024A91F4F|nr:uncharacterized protein LOC126824878 [Patella vulgata]